MTETQNIEYKQSWRDDFLKWICGFANARGGRIYIGKERGENGYIQQQNYALLPQSLSLVQN